MKHKNLQFVFLEAGAFFSDPYFIAMTAEQRGVYTTIIFALYENNGSFPLDYDILGSLCNCENIKKVWSVIKKKFYLKNSKIRQKRVDAELLRAKKRIQLASAKGVKGMKARWHSDNTAITKRREAKRSEGKRKEENRNIDSTAGSLTRPATGDRQQENSKAFGSQENSLGLSTRNASTISPPLKFSDIARAVIFFYDSLNSIFTGRTPADTKSLHNLANWVKDKIAAGKFNMEIFERILAMAVDSKSGKSRKPIAVFFAQVKRDLGYKKDE